MTIDDLVEELLEEGGVVLGEVWWKDRWDQIFGFDLNREKKSNNCKRKF